MPSCENVWGQVYVRVSGAHDAKNAWEAYICDVVDVEARVGLESCRIGVVEDIACVVTDVQIRVWKHREWSLGRRERSVRFEVGREVAVLMGPAEGVHVAVVEIEEVLPVLDEGIDDSLLLKSPISEDWVVDGDAAEIVVVLIIGRDESVGKVRHVETGIGFSRDVCGGALEVESVDEIAPETDELKAQFDFVGDIGDSLAEANADWLLYPDHIGSATVSPCFFYNGERSRLTDWSSCRSWELVTWCRPATGMGRFQSRGRSGNCSPDLHSACENSSESVVLRNIVISHQMTTSSPASGFALGKNQKYSCLSSPGVCEMGRSPA